MKFLNARNSAMNRDICIYIYIYIFFFYIEIYKRIQSQKFLELTQPWSCAEFLTLIVIYNIVLSFKNFSQYMLWVAKSDRQRFALDTINIYLDLIEYFRASQNINCGCRNLCELQEYRLALGKYCCGETLIRNIKIA